MGTYNQSGEEIQDKFETFLIEASCGEGDISASAVADAWNRLAKKHKWIDRLVSVDDVNELKNPPKDMYVGY